MAMVQIYFGSQSGTAECFAEEICEESAQHGISCEVLDLQTFKPDNFAARKIVVLVVSTYGEGEPTDNAVAFHSWASDPRHDGSLKGQRFSVMGLGDMNYSRFNNMGIETDLNLERLGGKRFYQRGVGDDSQDIAADFQAWKNCGFWTALKEAVAEVVAEGGFSTSAGGDAGNADSGPVVVDVDFKPQIRIFYAQEEAGGAAKDTSDALVEHMSGQELESAGVHSLSDRKAVEIVKKLPKYAVAVVIADCGPEGPCGAARKLARNMNIELDSQCLADKKIKLACLIVATSKCTDSAKSLQDPIQQQSISLVKAFDRAGIQNMSQEHPLYVDTGVQPVPPVIEALCVAIKDYSASAKSFMSPKGPSAKVGATAAANDSKQKHVRIYSAGEEAREAADALSGAWPGGGLKVDDANLQTLSAAARERARVILALECAADGGLADAARSLASQISAAPLAIQASLKQLTFALVAVVGSHYGNAGERASANAMRDELTQAIAPVKSAFEKIGAKCLQTASVDLQDAEGSKIADLCQSLSQVFPDSAIAPTDGVRTGLTTSSVAAVVVPLRAIVAATHASLPPEIAGEGSDVLARFSFEAEKTKVTKVRELRQMPDRENGLCTAEVEFEAVGSLKDYTLGGTLSLLPENDPEDVLAAARLVGLNEAQLDHFISWVPCEGGSANMKIKKPFPTPCTLRDAFARYCDLGRAPSRKMLQALGPKLDSESARAHVTKLVADSEALKVLSDSTLCCKMHEFWDALGVKKIDLADFLVNCPRQKPREFTIASSPKATPTRISLCVSMTSHELSNAENAAKHLIDSGCLPVGSKFRTRTRRFYGTCSKWMTTRLQSGDVLLAKQRASPLRLPVKDVPVIMFGAGAGVAPFRGFWEELRKGTQQAPAVLFFGCRNPEQDWLYKDEMNAAAKLPTQGCSALARVKVGPKRPLTLLFPAFSMPVEGKKKTYVQDLLRSNATSIKHWVEKMNGVVFICGSTGMGNGVLDGLADALEGGREFVDQLRKENRIVAEFWG